MMTGIYASSPALRDRARQARAERIEAKRAQLVARLHALKGGQS